MTPSKTTAATARQALSMIEAAMGDDDAAYDILFDSFDALEDAILKLDRRDDEAEPITKYPKTLEGTYGEFRA